MGNIRSLDRLGHTLLKRVVGLGTKVFDTQNEIFAATELKKSERIQLLKDTASEHLKVYKLVATIMQKAESAKTFSFTKEDEDMTIKEIADALDIDTCCDDEDTVSVGDIKVGKDNLHREIVDAAAKVAINLGLDPKKVKEASIHQMDPETAKKMIDILTKGKK